MSREYSTNNGTPQKETATHKQVEIIQIWDDRVQVMLRLCKCLKDDPEPQWRGIAKLALAEAHELQRSVGKTYQVVEERKGLCGISLGSEILFMPQQCINRVQSV